MLFDYYVYLVVNSVNITKGFLKLRNKTIKEAERDNELNILRILQDPKEINSSNTIDQQGLKKK
ncbi:hypothetical protein INT48_009540, partial [Thamnidium elegans]